MTRRRMHSASIRLVSVIGAGTAASAAAVVLVAGGTAYAASAEVPTAPSGPSSGLAAVSLLSASYGWAVGGNATNGLVERYDGSSFSIVPSANLIDHPGNSTNSAWLSGVDAVSSTSAFAVGTATMIGPGTVNAAVAERWNGSSWTRTPVPNPGSTNALTGVEATSSADAWAVGSSKPSVTTLPFAVHWNGTAWTQATTVAPGSKANVFNGVAGTSAHDVWAVGYSQDLPYGNKVKHSLIEHWNGTAWSQVPSPDFATGNQTTVLTAVAAVSPNNAWAVGNGSASEPGIIVLHWGGVTWEKLAVPAFDQVGGVTTVGCDLWLTGSIAGTPMVAHLHGGTWTVVGPTTPGALNTRTTLSGIAPNGSNGVIALGGTVDDTNGTGAPVAVRVTP